jgi:hypothetical protein
MKTRDNTRTTKPPSDSPPLFDLRRRLGIALSNQLFWFRACQLTGKGQEARHNYNHVVTWWVASENADRRCRMSGAVVAAGLLSALSRSTLHRNSTACAAEATERQICQLNQ